MNYEVKLFYDYDAITLDELKDKTNILLNLVTEALRPLRMTTGNGKEFLLFPQELLDPIYDTDFRMILLAAMRYATGRDSFAPRTVANYIGRHIRLLDDKTLALAADDIRRHLEDYGEHEPNPTLWRELLATLEARHRGEVALSEKLDRLCPGCGALLEVMSMADSWHTPSGFDVIAHCRSCDSDYEWYRDKDSIDSEMKRYFFG